MIKDKVGFLYFSEEELLEELYKNSNIDLSKFRVTSPYTFHTYRDALNEHFEDINDTPQLADGIDSHDKLNRQWQMPDEYKQLDIAKWVLDQCETDAELQRCGEELIMFQERDMLGLLQYLKYFVDTMRENNIVWGVGRGSSVASYVLFLIGVHKINSLYYDLDVKEFLRD